MRSQRLELARDLCLQYTHHKSSTALKRSQIRTALRKTLCLIQLNCHIMLDEKQTAIRLLETPLLADTPYLLPSALDRLRLFFAWRFKHQTSFKSDLSFSEVTDSPTLNLMGCAFQAQSQLDLALTSFQRSARANEDGIPYLPALHNLLVLAYAQNQPEAILAAVTSLLDALSLFLRKQSEASCQNFSAEFFQEVINALQHTARKLFVTPHKADQLIIPRLYQTAIDLTQRLFPRPLPSHLVLHSELIQVFLSRSQVVEAVAAGRVALTLYPYSIEMHLVQAELLGLGESWSEALDVCKRAEPFLFSTSSAPLPLLTAATEEAASPVESGLPHRASSHVHDSVVSQYYSTLGLVYQALNRLEDCRHSWNKARLYEPATTGR
eukprot:m.331433 g.331433  ORF g.331433 m.331433 type:complete len:381 (-) comp55622_c0_seq20:2036-3178(-)